MDCSNVEHGAEDKIFLITGNRGNKGKNDSSDIDSFSQLKNTFTALALSDLS
jgi:hypothetical protein